MGCHEGDHIETDGVMAKRVLAAAAAVAMVVLNGCGSDAEGSASPNDSNSAASSSTVPTSSSTTLEVASTGPVPTEPPTTLAPPTTAVPTAPTWDEIKNAAVPSMCDWPATTLVDGIDRANAGNGGLQMLPILPDGKPGLVSGVPSGAGPLTAVVVNCNAGGVGWPDQIMFFQPGGTYLTYTDMFEYGWERLELGGPARNGVTNLELTDGTVRVYTQILTMEDAACCPTSEAVVWLEVPDRTATVIGAEILGFH